ncbi:ATP-binding cassette sub-family F member 1 [Thecamonas trahens ATCC 50062]|uniref:ATP-binding cassette sub-family F member 1 n=1 Tax=Thecamonas trahens ATCC 50062 TaxID=461836 RepID=A0A0L0DSJ8_THETB|nr:ATP-binding cassette sub-family F member 1 [Thecamonas trahens ATCC 50062]KNC55245.1 ATP-binding cassette sub-family F member 1 [Thecamonas trahens ATCC 50062]|eukprot:XP_013753174.1 ATP-binding cassette sub-family F member 1 [Thecamonas trahens ATCC 50062]
MVMVMVIIITPIIMVMVIMVMVIIIIIICSDRLDRRLVWLGCGGDETVPKTTTTEAMSPRPTQPIPDLSTTPMAHLTIENLSLSVGSSVLLDSVSAHAASGQRVALVGRNGCGKSTLLRAVAAAVAGVPCEPEAPPYYVIGAGTIDGGQCAAGSAVLVEQDALQWRTLLGAGDEADLVALPVADAIEWAAAEGSETALDDADGWRRVCVAAHEVLEWRTAGYDETPIAELSPGCAMRAYLAIAIYRYGIQLLILDEPTNHLDLPSIMWLQKALVASGKTVLVVSHDAAFLDAVCDHVWAVDADSGSLAVSGASYSDFRRAEDLAREQHIAAFEAQEKRHKKLTAAADKLKQAAASGQRFAGKDKDKLQRDFKRDRAGRSGRKAKAVEKLRDGGGKLDKLVLRSPLSIDIEPLGAGFDSSLMLEEAVIGYGDARLPLPPLSLRVDFGERVALVGFNGVGKSTLLRTLIKTQPPVEGRAVIGRELCIGNLTQEHESLPRHVSPRAHFMDLTGEPRTRTGARLLRYGLTRRQVDCPIGELNPGARVRALLASFSMRKVNTLILDEPTNHLDEEAVDEVIATLNEFAGTVVVVSHSLAFLRALELSRILRLDSAGLTEVGSLDAFVDEIDDAAADVVVACGWT